MSLASTPNVLRSCVILLEISLTWVCAACTVLAVLETPSEMRAVSGIVVTSPTPSTVKRDSLVVLMFWMWNGMGPNNLVKAKRQMKAKRTVRIEMRSTLVVPSIVIFNYLLLGLSINKKINRYRKWGFKLICCRGMLRLWLKGNRLQGRNNGLRILKLIQ